MYKTTTNQNRFAIKNYFAIGLTISLFSLLTATSCNTKQWYEDKEYIASLGTKDIGLIKEVMVNNVSHKVRLIGIDHDEDTDGNKLHTTWEFANLISDSKGYSLGWQWLDTNEPHREWYIINGDYPNSSLRKILCGSGNFSSDVYCASKDSFQDWDLNYTNKTVLSMLPDSLTKNLKTVKKTVRTGEDFETVSDCSDKLFILSDREITGYETKQDEGKLYEYYKDNTDKYRMVKKQVYNCEYDPYIPYIEDDRQLFKGYITNYAGFNYKTDETAGGLYWTRTSIPWIGFAVRSIDVNGTVGVTPLSTMALGVAPCFCL